MNKFTNISKRLYFLGLVVSYVIGTNLFMYLKLLGLDDLKDVSIMTRNALLPLSTLMGLTVALGIAVLEFNVFNKWKNYSFRKFVFYKYSIIIFLVVAGTLIVFSLYAFFVDKEPLDRVLLLAPQFLKTELFFSVLIYLFLFSILLNILKTIGEYLGPQAIMGAVLGKYNQPSEEDLTFIFIDLTSSTSIAEKMGHVKYSLFIEKSFQLITEAIYEYNATIYQFVGDEAVLLWKTKAAKKNMAPIRLYYDFLKKLEEARPDFLAAFGEAPHFRASVHAGFVTVTEIRTIKKDIVYHGDVLNTCARILEQCSQLKKNLLVSARVAEWVPTTEGYSIEPVNNLTLRGKQEETVIYEVTSYK